MQNHQKYFPRFFAGCAVFLSLLCGEVFAYDCANVGVYADGSPYDTNAIVQNNGVAYQCEVGGWCSIGGPYEPGVGWAWAEAWNDLGSCSGGSSSSSSSSSSSTSSSSSSGGGGGACPLWVAGQQYYTGDIVSYNGANYIAEHDNPGYDPTISTWFWEPTTQGCGGGGSTSSSSSSSSGGGPLHISEAQFNQLFPNRNPFYTYQGLVNGAASFPAFGASGSVETQKREVAAALANFAHETGDFVHITEVAQGEYCDNSWGGPGCECRSGKRYYGRGPIQLSWNGNYCAAGNYIGIDLVSNPDLVETDATIAWQAALWFWMTQTGAGSYTAHDAMVQGYGFAETIETINGALECRGQNRDKVANRIANYQKITDLLGVTPGGNLDCNQ